ncbi:hypothetical protein Tco_0550288 [Tanacetum coccineum]
MLAKFIDEGKREHEEMEIFIKEFRTTNELSLKEQSNLLSELKIENEPPRFKQDVQEKPHDDGVENKSLSIPERTIQPLVNPQQSSNSFPNRSTKEKEENLKQLHYNTPFIKALVQMPKYAKYLKSLLTNKSRLEEGCTVDKLILPIDFVILDMPEDSRILIILRRPFLVTIRAMIDVFNKNITLRVGDDEVIFDMDQSNIETKDKKRAENLAADHLSRLENPHMEVLTEREIAEEFPDEQLMVLRSKFKYDEPCESCLIKLNVSAELRDGAYENIIIYKERTKKWHDSRLHGDKDFKDLAGKEIDKVGKVSIIWNPMCVCVVVILVTDNQEKDKIRAKTTRNEHGNGKSVMKSKSQS